MSVRTRVYELDLEEPMQVMVEDFVDGSQTIAVRYTASDIWGPKHDPIIDDDGDHIRAPEHKVIGDPEFAAYLNGIRIERKEGES